MDIFKATGYLGFGPLPDIPQSRQLALQSKANDETKVHFLCFRSLLKEIQERVHIVCSILNLCTIS